MVDRTSPSITSNTSTITANEHQQPNKQSVQQFERTLAADNNEDTADNWIFPGDHHYQMKNQICQKSSSCTSDSVRSELLEKGAFPGQKAPVIDNGTAQRFSVELPIVPGEDHIYSVPTPAGVTNITDTDHFLYPGWVVRDIVVDNSTVYIQTTGGGSGWAGGINNQMKHDVWDQVDDTVKSSFK